MLSQPKRFKQKRPWLLASFFIIVARYCNLPSLYYWHRSPPVPQNMPGFNTYTGQLSVSAGDAGNGQWPTDGELKQIQSSYTYKNLQKQPKMIYPTFVMGRCTLQGFSSRRHLHWVRGRDRGRGASGRGGECVPRQRGLPRPPLLPLQPLHLLPARLFKSVLSIIVGKQQTWIFLKTQINIQSMLFFFQEWPLDLYHLDPWHRFPFRQPPNFQYSKDFYFDSSNIFCFLPQNENSMEYSSISI